MTENERKVETIFMGALELSSTAERNAFLEKECGDDHELRKQVDALLDANSDMGSFLEQTRDVPTQIPIREQTGTSIGPYKLLEQIGEGGMGVVYIAEQREPVKRRVALKIIKPGMDTGEVMARFEAERQALAMMEHPNIAKVLDAGATETGRPYFVMELVQGMAITDYCDQNQLASNERLHLFVDVCHAIQHAHHKGIIHRDVKPTNVLVSSHDGKPLVKVIDFGVAKAINQQLTERTIYTHTSQIVGTPLYMSPEQADLSGSDIDTRTDIYSLGVLLYEMLTGETPFDKQRLREAAYDEMRRIIREEDPPRPSTKISTLGESASTVSQNRSTDPKRLRQMLRGDIDWIVMKALEKDRSRRYETANGFALDVERFLRHEPVLAGPPSTSYRVRKFVGRNRAGVIAASLVALALILGLIGTGSGFIWALKESKRASLAATKAETKEKTTRSVLDFFVGLFEEASPSKRMGNPMTVLEFLDVGAGRIEELGHEPDAMATLQETIGTLYIVLSEYEKAESQLLSAHAYRQIKSSQSLQDELAFASILDSLAALYQWTETAKGETMSRQASEIFERLLGDSPELANSLNVLGNCLQRQNKIPQSLVAHEKSLAVRQELWPPGHEKHSHVATALHNIGIAYFYDDDLPKAEQYFKQSIEIEQQYSEPDDPDLATAKHVLSIVYANQSKFENAKKWQLESFETRKKVFAEDHDHVGLSNNWLGNIYRGLKRYSEAEPLLRRALEIHTAVYGDDNELVYWDKECLLRGLIKLEKFDEALALQQEMAESTGRESGFANRRSVNKLLGDILFGQGKIDQSRTTYLATLEMFDNANQRQDRFTAIARLRLLVIDAMQGRPFSQQEYADAIKYLLDEEKWIEADAELLQLQTDIADVLFDANQTDQAGEIYETVKQNHLAVVAGQDADAFLIDHAARFLLTCKDPSLRDLKLGLSLATKANELTGQQSPHYLATLAIAQHASDDAAQAAITQQLAIDQLPEDSFWRDRFVKDLERFKGS